jgi:hypothetical protein
VTQRGWVTDVTVNVANVNNLYAGHLTGRLRGGGQSHYFQAPRREKVLADVPAAGIVVAYGGPLRSAGVEPARWPRHLNPNSLTSAVRRVGDLNPRTCVTTFTD